MTASDDEREDERCSPRTVARRSRRPVHVVRLPPWSASSGDSSTSPVELVDLDRSRRTTIAMARAQDLLELRRDEEAGLAVLGERQDQPLDLGLGADVDAARRLVEDQDLRVRRQPAGEDTFCWLPPLSVPDRLVGDGVAMRSGPMYWSAIAYCSAQAQGLSQPRPAWTARTMFSRTVRSSMIPSALRSSGQSATPRSIDASGEWCATGLPSTRDRARCRACRSRTAAGPSRSGPSRAGRPVRRPRPRGARGRTARSSPSRPSLARPPGARRRSPGSAGRELDLRHVVELGEVPAEHLGDQLEAGQLAVRVRRRRVARCAGP